MSQSLTFRVLGPLSVHSGTRSLDIPGARQRILLAALLVRFNQVVPVDELVDRIWGESPPHRPRRALHTCITRLRHATAGQDERGLIRTSHSGYAIEVAPENLDLARFTQLLDEARAAARREDPVAEHRALDRALALWRGRALPDVESDSLHRDVVPRLHEQWIWALERRGELALRLGRHHEVVGELRALTVEHPFHEPFWQLFVLALHRCGRRSEALLHYAELAGRMREELGVEPGSRLRALHLAVLRDEVGTPAADNPPARRAVS
ncbi:AfsR/SARP family transcriptional regulator [Saccharopolyspora sp. MS10]|uniref:AfsR/SARP family transcriptional regulator n=1 Tax=Saccharopolyspora sp. MS10 TaxID=3385973 RepID=UPI00399F8D57